MPKPASIILDISRTLDPTIAVWPGDTPFSLTPTLSMQTGSSVNLTTLTLSAHTGTHIDAPKHYQPDGQTIETLELVPYWGLAQVMRVTKDAGELTPDDLPDVIRAPRLLLHTNSSARVGSVFDSEIVFPGEAFAAFLGTQGVVLLGTDAPSMDDVNSKALPGHHALLANGVSILEGLQLSDVPDGLYELVALPLKILGGDGSPVRAALRTLE